LLTPYHKNKRAVDLSINTARFRGLGNEGTSTPGRQSDTGIITTKPAGARTFTELFANNIATYARHGYRPVMLGRFTIPQIDTITPPQWDARCESPPQTLVDQFQEEGGMQMYIEQPQYHRIDNRDIGQVHERWGCAVCVRENNDSAGVRLTSWTPVISGDTIQSVATAFAFEIIKSIEASAEE